jgi:hypothetical protein
MSIVGRFRITAMDVWGQPAFDLLGPAFFSFDGKSSGSFRFIAVEGWMDCRHGTRAGKPFVEFTWDGHDERDPASGRGWAALKADGSLTGHIFLHQGDDSGFTAIPADDMPEARAEACSKTKRGRR